MTRVMRDYLYKPYLRELSAIQREIAPRLGSVEFNTVRVPEIHVSKRGWKAWKSDIRRAMDATANYLHGYVITAD